jgi:3-oxoacyl-[acyl-carrier-protein] synthase II
MATPPVDSSSQRRVVITGMGLISPFGNTVAAFRDALDAGRSGVRPLTSLPTDHLPLTCGAEAVEFTGKIDDFGPLQKEQKRAIRKGIKVMCREIQMGVAAAQCALNDAGLAPGDYDVDRTGVVFGSDYILTTPDEFRDGVSACLDGDGKFIYERWAEHGLPKITPLWLLKYLPNMPASHIAIYNDLRGPSNSITMREASSNLAIGEAWQLIARGSADTIVAGATGTRVHSLRTLHVVLQEEVATADGAPERLSRPFDLNRSGMVLGEGAGSLVLEELSSAQARGATIWGEILGRGSSAVINTAQRGDRQQAVGNVLRQAMESSGLTPEQVGHIHAHGNATRSGDALEAQAIRTAMAARSKPVPVMAAKSNIGNPGAAAGVMETIASILAMQRGTLFPVLNYETPDPECPVEVVRSDDVAAGDNFINLNVTPLGQASSLVVAKYR